MPSDTSRPSLQDPRLLTLPPVTRTQCSRSRPPTDSPPPGPQARSSCTMCHHRRFTGQAEHSCATH
eukprot:15029431-Alexandrium_andersonii.AAC.1